MSLPSWVTDRRAGLPVTETCIYFQTGTKGPLGRSVWQAWQEAEARGVREGPVAPKAKAPLVADAQAARESLARLLHVPPDELCWSFNTSTAMRTVCHSLSLTQDDLMVTSDQEHVATRSLYGGLRDACGLRVRVLDTADGRQAFLERLEDALQSDPARRRIVLLSHVSCLDGQRLPVAEAVALARCHGAISLIDGAQAVGQIPVDLRQLDADFYLGTGQKWLLGPIGVSYLHVRANQLETFNPNWLPAADRVGATAATLGETGSVNLALRVALGAAIEEALAIGLDRIEAHVAKLAQTLRAGLQNLPGLSILGPTDPALTTGLVAFTVDGFGVTDCEHLVDRLYRDYGILIKFQAEQTALRVSLASFNSTDDVEALLTALGALCKEGSLCP